eukprot:2421853-Amphidinium_carterae.1
MQPFLMQGNLSTPNSTKVALEKTEQNTCGKEDTPGHPNKEQSCSWKQEHSFVSCKCARLLLVRTAEPLEYLDASSPHVSSSSSFAASKYGRGLGQPVLLRGLADKWQASSTWASPSALLESRGSGSL